MNILCPRMNVNIISENIHKSLIKTLDFESTILRTAGSRVLFDHLCNSSLSEQSVIFFIFFNQQFFFHF